MAHNLTSDAYVAFVEALKAFRVERGVSQAELATKMGKPQSFVSKSERRERRIDVIEFIAIAEALGADPGKLLTELASAEAKARAKRYVDESLF